MVEKPLHEAAVGDGLFAANGRHLYAVSPGDVAAGGVAGHCLGVVFSLTPTAYDRARGVLHGYALAAADAAAACRWADEAAWHRKMLFLRRPPRCARLYRPDSLFCRDGLRCGNVIGTDCDYPAFYNAMTYGRLLGSVQPMRCFLPAAGQWLELLSALAAPWFAAEGGASLSAGCRSGNARLAALAINGRLEAFGCAPLVCAGGGNVFWSATPAAGRSAYALAFYGREDVAAVCAFPASARCRVRPIIAF